MMIDGRKIAREIREQLREKIEKSGTTPRMDIISLSQDKAIKAFVRKKKRFGKRIGVNVVVHDLPENTTEGELIGQLENIFKQTDGVVIQLPLPQHIDTEKILKMIPVKKDIDVLNPESIENFAKGMSGSIPPVPGAVKEVLKIVFEAKDPTSLSRATRGRKIVLAGYGKLVGQPVGMLFDREGIPYKVIDKETSPKDKDGLLKNADIIISGIGQSHSIKSEDIKDGVVLIDAGTSELAKKMVGDIDPECYEKASLYTPVPGGVGPITIAILFRNLVNGLTK